MSNNQIFRKKVQMIIKLHFFYCFLAHFLLESVVCWFTRSIKFSNYPGTRHITTKKKRKNQATNDKSPSNNHCFKARFCTCWSLSKQNADLFGQNSVLRKTKRRFDINETPIYFRKTAFRQNRSAFWFERLQQVQNRALKQWLLL